MQIVAQKFEDEKTVPFTMRYMGQPEAADKLPSLGITMTTTYSTSCGTNNSPDDGETSVKDDN